MTMKGGGETVLLLADARDRAAWARAEARRDGLRGSSLDRGGRRRVLLRDTGEMETLFPRLADPEDAAGRGVRHVFATQQRFFLSHFGVGEIRSFSPLSGGLAAFFGEVAPGIGIAAEEETPPVPAPKTGAGDGVWVAVHDAATPATKTSEVIARACAEEGRHAAVWETGVLRARVLLEEDDDAFVSPSGAGTALRERIERRLDEEGIGTVLGLDLNWFLDATLFLDHPGIERVASLWFDDVKAWCQASYNTCFPGAAARLPAAIRHPKVLHCCYGRGQMEEMRLLGFENVKLSFLAAPAEYLRRRELPSSDPEVRGKAAFIGNPGLNIAPPPGLVALLERGGDLDAVRALAREMALLFARSHFAALIAREPSIPALFAHALEVRAREPYVPAASIVRALGDRYPAALAALNASGEILNALLVVKMSNQFDRPALVHRLWRAGLLDVHSHPDAWRPYGIEARPDVPFHRLPEVYQRYLCHLNGSNACRDATANEKLFEIAACGRVSVNLASPDVLACYREGEIAAVSSLAEAEERVRGFLADPDAALAFGERARRRTAAEHLWNHRLRGILPPAHPSSPS